MSATADISKVISGLNAAKARKRAAAAKALGKFANHVIGDSQQLTPVDTGALQASGTVGDVEEKGEKLQVVIGHNTNYAAPVHERTQVPHEIGQAKFLATAVKNNAAKMGPYIAGEVAKVKE